MVTKKIIRTTTVPESLKILLKGQLKYINQNGYELVGVSSDKPELIEVSQQEGIRVQKVNMTRQITPLRDFISLINMYKVLVKEKPQIVHTHTPKAGLIGMIAAYFAKVPIRLHTVAGLPLMESIGIKKSILVFVEKITYWCATKVYPNSFGLKKYIIENKFINKNKVKVIGNGSSNGIDTSYFDPSLVSNKDKNTLRDSLKINKNDFVFIFVGRVNTDKGVNELVKSFDKLCVFEKKIKLILVGSYESKLDPLRKKTMEIIDSNEKILSVGFQNDVRPYFAIASCLVFPSYREGFPNVVLQAGSMGLPAIVSDINGCNEIITNNVNGLIIKAKNSDMLFNTMKIICSDNAMVKRLKLKTRQMIISKYERKYLWELILNEYNNLLKSL